MAINELRVICPEIDLTWKTKNAAILREHRDTLEHEQAFVEAAEAFCEWRASSKCVDDVSSGQASLDALLAAYRGHAGAGLSREEGRRDEPAVRTHRPGMGTYP